jgi:hypothetical protein
MAILVAVLSVKPTVAIHLIVNLQEPASCQINLYLVPLAIPLEIWRVI